MQLQSSMQPESTKDHVRDDIACPVQLSQARHPRDGLAEQRPARILTVAFFLVIGLKVDSKYPDGSEEVVLKDVVETLDGVIGGGFGSVPRRDGQGQRLVPDVACEAVKVRAGQGKVSDALGTCVGKKIDDLQNDIAGDVGQRWQVGIGWNRGPCFDATGGRLVARPAKDAVKDVAHDARHCEWYHDASILLRKEKPVRIKRRFACLPD